MSGRRTDVAKFRREYERSIHKLMPFGIAYSAALAEGDSAGCEVSIETLAQILVDDFNLPRGRRVVVANVAMIKGPAECA